MSVISLDIVVNGLEDVLNFFDRIEVYRSTSGSAGAYTELTNAGPDPTPAVLDGANAGGWALDGLTLSIAIDGASPKVVVFEGTNPLDLASVIEQINEAQEDLASEVPTDTNRLRLTSGTTGTGSSLQVTGSAASVLGLSATKVNGKERRQRIAAPTSVYQFFDRDGSASYWYRTRYSNSITTQVSEFSEPRQGEVDVLVPPAQTIAATVNLVTGIGEPVKDRALVFVLMSTHQVPTTTYWAVPGFDSRVEVRTNEAGFAQVRLLRGAKYRVFLEGTSFMREFITPTLGESFDLMSIAGTQPDPFDIVQVPPRPIKVTI
jgi:hypothetical protein